jgi:hypothetical protein
VCVFVCECVFVYAFLCVWGFVFVCRGDGTIMQPASGLFSTGMRNLFYASCTFSPSMFSSVFPFLIFLRCYKGF